MASGTAFVEHTASLVGAAVLALAVEEQRVAHEALTLTDPRRWRSLEWHDRNPGPHDAAGRWPRAIACSLR